MRLKVKDVNLSTGGPLIIIINEKDARKLDLHPLDRIKLDSIVASVNIAEDRKGVKPGEIGLFEEVFKKTKVRSGQWINIDVAERPDSVYYIKKKLKGGKLSNGEIREITHDIVHNNLSQIELTYFVSACYTFGLDMNEVLALTKAIAFSGKTLGLRKKVVVDKHSIGGVPGNRTTMIIVPILTAMGICMPKTSSRAITSASGTADSMEVLAPVTHSLSKIRSIVKKTNGCIVWGGALELASADDVLIKIEYPLSLDPKGILLASIMSKKMAVGSKYVLIDIPCGEATKISSGKKAAELRENFVKLGKRLGMKVGVVLTKGDRPIGRGIGPVLEARDVLWVLQRDSRRPLDLENKSVQLACNLLEMLRIRDGQKKVMDILNSGKAFEKMQEIIKAQGGKMMMADNLGLGKCKWDVIAKKSVIVKKINNAAISRVARVLGAPVDKGAGVYLYAGVGGRIRKGSKMATLYAHHEKRLAYGIKMWRRLGVVKH